MVTVRWSDGKIQSAPNYAALLRKIYAAEWNAEWPDEESFRRELARRAYVWSTTIVDPTLPPRELFLALADADVLEVIA